MVLIVKLQKSRNPPYFRWVYFVTHTRLSTNMFVARIELIVLAVQVLFRTVYDYISRSSSSASSLRVFLAKLDSLSTGSSVEFFTGSLIGSSDEMV